jgi:hypothetical protein
MSVATADVKIGYNHPFSTENSFGLASSYFCIQQQQPQQQQNIYSPFYNSSSNYDAEKDPNKLIQAATNRLRQKRLEFKYQQLKSEIIEIQSKLDIIKLEASIALDSIANCTATQQLHLDHFEKRLENYKLQLQQAIITSSSLPKVDNSSKRPLSLSSLTKSSFSSTISSILSPTRKNSRSTVDDLEEDFYASLNGSTQSVKRRKRQLSKQQQTKEETNFIHPLETTRSLEEKVILVQAQQEQERVYATSSPTASSASSSYAYKNNMESSDIGTKRELLVLHSINDDNSSSFSGSFNGGSKSCISSSCCSCCDSCSSHFSSNSINSHPIRNINTAKTTMSILSKRNALDDTISFLNDLASDTDDGGFRQELLQLVDTIIRHNNNDDSLCSTNSVYQQLLLQQQQQQQPLYYYCTTMPSYNATKKHCFIRRILNNIISTSWKYIRFALVMTLAILINLKKGPKSI